MDDAFNYVKAKGIELES